MRFHGHGADADAKKISLVFVKDGVEQTITDGVGQSMLEFARSNGVELEGACEESLACSTCHVILDDDFFDTLEEPCDDEYDMLDQAFGLSETSRLSCQIMVTESMDGQRIELPKATRNFYVDGHVPQPH